MKPFESLSHRGQIQRLRKVAHLALAQYAVPEPRLLKLRHVENTTFRVVAADQQHYVLRIHRADSLASDAIRSELTWLTALRQETDLRVPEPVRTRDGSLLTVVEAAGMPEPRACVLFRWLAGRFFDKTLTPQHLERVGVFMAQLHEHTSRWQPPAGFVRGRADAISAAARRSLWRPSFPSSSSASRFPADEDGAQTLALVSDHCSSQDAVIVARTLEQIRAVFQTLGEGKEVFGLIHADLHQQNYFFQRGAPRVIDFDDCGWGHYLFDLTVTLRELAHLPHYPRLRTALLAGYRTIRPFPAQHEAYLETFFALRRIQLLIWVIESREHPAFRASWAAWTRNDLQELAGFLARA